MGDCVPCFWVRWLVVLQQRLPLVVWGFDVCETAVETIEASGAVEGEGGRREEWGGSSATTAGASI